MSLFLLTSEQQTLALSHLPNEPYKADMIFNFTWLKARWALCPEKEQVLGRREPIFETLNLMMVGYMDLKLKTESLGWRGRFLRGE